MKNVSLAEKRFKKSENFYLLGLMISKMAIFFVVLPLMILGIYMAQTMTTVPTAAGITGIVAVIISGIIYVMLTLKKLVPWGMEIGDFFFKALSPRLFHEILVK